jgi:hypothetical protein
MVTDASLPPALRARALRGLDADPAVERFAVDGTVWLRLAHEPLADDVEPRVALLAPFDPVVWDRRRFAALWGWEYRLEAYTPPAKRRLGYYALPLLWRDDVIGWANAKLAAGELDVAIGYAKPVPRGAGYREALAAEIERLRDCVGARAVRVRGIAA